MPLRLPALITERVDVQNTDASTMTLLLKLCLCKSPPTSTARSSPFFAFMVICISRRAASHASSCTPSWSPNASSASSSMCFVARDGSVGFNASSAAVAARAAPSMISFASETEMAAARSGPIAWSTAPSTFSSGALAVAPMITTCAFSSSKHSSRNASAPFLSRSRPSSTMRAKLASFLAMTSWIHSARRIARSSLLIGSRLAAACAAAACDARDAFS
mmetsp:Transcript_6949/g.28520  ORF Transcript_6949/g.28520 Transcript_6949/m.28520 type:complete len:219 (-) Transcript_6949:1080-1736(-)